jgi:hypothetical protein
MGKNLVFEGNKHVINLMGICLSLQQRKKIPDEISIISLNLRKDINLSHSAILP